MRMTMIHVTSLTTYITRMFQKKIRYFDCITTLERHTYIHFHIPMKFNIIFLNGSSLFLMHDNEEASHGDHIIIADEIMHIHVL